MKKKFHEEKIPAVHNYPSSIFLVKNSALVKH